MEQNKIKKQQKYSRSLNTFFCCCLRIRFYSLIRSEIKNNAVCHDCYFNPSERFLHNLFIRVTERLYATVS